MSNGLFERAAVALRAAGIRAVLMRDDPRELGSLDELDVLVPRAELDRAVRVLVTTDWELSDGGRFHPCKRALLGLEGDRLVKLDLHGALIDRALEYLDAEWMLATSVDRGIGFVEPSREAFAAHVALHVVLGKPALPDKLRERFLEACGAGLDVALVQAQAGLFGLGALARELVMEPTALADPARVTRFAQRARRRLLLRPANLARTLAQAIVWSLGPALGLRRGFLIAVIGPDGTGKSSFIAALIERLHAQDVPARSVYMGPWEPTRLPSSRFLAWLGANPLDAIPGTTPDHPPLVRFTKRIKGTLRRHAWYMSALVDVWARWLGHVLPRLLLRRIVIADRYVFDVEVGYYNELVRNSPRVRRAVASLAPRPRLTVLLDDEPERVVARKPEYPLATIAAARGAYLDLARRRGFEVLRVDRTPDELARAFLAAHWRDIVRWRGT